MKEYLTDLEIAKIEAFTKDTDMREAVKKVLLQALYRHGTVLKGESIFDPKINAAFSLAAHSLQYPMSDEQVGSQVRAMFSGVNALKNAFEDLEKIKLDVQSPFTDENEAI